MFVPFRHQDPSRSVEELAAEARAYARAEPAVRLMRAHLENPNLACVWPRDYVELELLPALEQRPDLRAELLHEMTGLFPEIINEMTLDEQRELLARTLRTTRATHLAAAFHARAATLLPYLDLELLFRSLMVHVRWDAQEPGELDRGVLATLIRDLTDGREHEPIIVPAELFKLILPSINYTSLPEDILRAAGLAFFAHAQTAPSETFVGQGVADRLDLAKLVYYTPLSAFRMLFEMAGQRLFDPLWVMPPMPIVTPAFDDDQVAPPVAMPADGCGVNSWEAPPPYFVAQPACGEASAHPSPEAEVADADVAHTDSTVSTAADALDGPPPGPIGSLQEIEQRLECRFADSRSMTDEFVRNLDTVILLGKWLTEKLMRPVIITVLLALESGSDDPAQRKSLLADLDSPKLCKRFLDALQTRSALNGAYKTLKNKPPTYAKMASH